MRILIIGSSKAAEVLTNFLSEDENHLVFTTKEGTDGNFVCINQNDTEELKEFALANEINLTIVADISLFNGNYHEIFTAAGLGILIPDNEALKITSSKSFSKKFIYKNKIKTPRFAFFEKSVPAIEYARDTEYPIVIKPDGHNASETAYIAETFSSAKKYIEKLFQTDNKKVLIEDYIFGKEVSFYVISDGFGAIVLDSVYTHRGEISIKDTLSNELQEKIYSQIIFPTISNLASNGIEYTGILGFDTIITPSGEIYLIEYNPFFKDIDIEIMLRGTDEDWAKLFMDAIIGTLQDNFKTPFSVKKTNNFWGSFLLEICDSKISKEEIVTLNAKTLNLLKTKFLEEGLKKEDLNEAEKLWKL